MEAVAEKPNSTHRVEVVRVKLEPIEGADRVALTRVFDYSCVCAKADWKDGDLGAWLPPDSLADVSRPEFAFLAKDAKQDGKVRIKAKRLRGVLSFGLLVPAPDGSKEGDDVAELLGVEHYSPDVQQAKGKTGLFTGGEVAAPPNVYTVKYDLEAGRRYAKSLFQDGEPCWVSEKAHGAHAKFCFSGGTMHCSSRGEWKKEYPTYDHVTVESLLATGKVDEERAKAIVEKLRGEPKKRNMWWQALDKTPALREFCEKHPDYIVHGEVLGCQDLPYGLKKGDVAFLAFDIMKDGRWLDFEEAYGMATAFGIPWVPVLEHDMPFDFDRICEMAEGQSLVPGASNIREGVVVGSLKERYDPRLGRAKLKWVSAAYLERAK